MWSNTSIERVKFGQLPRMPMTNDQRLQIFRTRRAATCTTEFTTIFPAGRLPGTTPKEQQR